MLDCAGKPLAVISTGFTRRLRRGPRLTAVGDVTEVVYLTSTGTGEEEDAVGLFAFVGGRIKQLWQHTALDAISQEGGPPYSIVDTWAYANDGRTIRIADSRVPGFLAYPKSFPAKLAHVATGHPETFCWNAEKLSYIGCPNS